MDTKGMLKNLPAMSRKGRYLLFAVLCISFLLLAILAALFVVDKSNVKRYRAENYERYAGNEEAFRAVIAGTDGFVANLNTSLYAIPYFEEASMEDVRACLLQEDVYMTDDDSESPFDKSTQPHNLIGRLKGLVMANQSFSDIVLYNRKSGVGLAITGNGRYSTLCTSAQELDGLLRLHGDPGRVEDDALMTAEPTQYACSKLYYVRHFREDLVLLCGLADAAWRETLLADSSGRSYQTMQVLLTLPSGEMILRDERTSLRDIPIDPAMIDAAQRIQLLGRYTLMHYDVKAPDCILTAILRDTGATDAVVSHWFLAFMAVNVLWLLAVAAICTYMLIRVFKPLKAIGDGLPAIAGETDELEKIAGAIHRYDQQLSSSSTTIAMQIQQLRRAYLLQLALGQYPGVTQEQVEALRINELLEKYILITVYPDDGRWTEEQFSAQENQYRRHIMVAAAQELLKAAMQRDGAEFLMCEACLLIVVPIREDAQETSARRTVERCVIDMGMQLKKRFQFGISKVRSGLESFSHAYHEATRHAALLEEQESGRSEDISLNALLKQNMHLADLVYMERYNDAYTCFEEMVKTLFRQKSRHLRNQQLLSLLSLTLCMLTETNKTNAALLEQMNMDASELLTPEDEEAVLCKWRTVFGELEARKDKRIRGQYSGQFAAVYQYMHAHFRDPGLSLSMLAEQFGMSVSTLSREFQKNLGQGFLESLHMMRIEAAKYEIEHTNAPLSDIAVAVGYTNTLTMTRAFKKYMGSTPSVFRKKDSPG